MSDIKLHEKSEEYLRSVFSRYTFEETLPKPFRGKFTLHMYAESDTYEGEDLDGYADSLFFRLDIYDIVNKKKYSIPRRDGITVLGVPLHVRIFKDGSTALFSTGEFEVDIFQSVEIFPVGFFERINDNE